MKRCLVLPLVLFACLVACTSARTVPPTSSDVVQAEIRTALDSFSETSSRGDLAGVMAKFDEQADILLVGSNTGEVYRGRTAIEAWLGSLYTSNGFAWQMERVDISHAGETAWAFVEGRMNVSDKATGKLRFSVPYRFSAVYVKRGNEWLLHFFHGSVPGSE